MTVDNFSRMDHFQSKTLVFSTPISFAEKASERQVEWVVDFYPKGVCYFKHYLIVWQVAPYSLKSSPLMNALFFIAIVYLFCVTGNS